MHTDTHTPSLLHLLTLTILFTTTSCSRRYHNSGSAHSYSDHADDTQQTQTHTNSNSNSNSIHDPTNHANSDPLSNPQQQQQQPDEQDEQYTTIYSSCSDTTVDGMYYIKPDANSATILPVICSNGYVMLDGSLDANLQSYPSLLSSHDYGRFNKYYILSDLDDLSTYRQWLLFADDQTKFNVAPGCMSCGDGQFGDNTVYYIDSHTYCFSGAITTGCIDDYGSANYHAESCNQCDVGVFPNDDPENEYWTKCMALQLDADHAIDHDHTSCVAHGLTFHPVISNVRDACTCYQPQENDGVIAYQVPISELPLVTARHDQYTKYGFAVADNIQFDPAYAQNAEEMADIDERDSNVVYLYNSDFVHGTYRITQSGTYVLMEDIVFNFNAPSEDEVDINDADSFSPNSIDVDELYWYPTREQAQPDGEYPGLYSYAGPFTLGFFAGISIETNYVTIDLNGFSLAQHPLFYFQQRFFALIEMASQPFVPGQGPANWGAGTDVYAEYVTIKNGELGLSSHHGIHGNNNNNVTITNVNTAQFDVAGIQCNSCTNVEISDCVIGPQNNEIPLLGRYTHARAFLPRLKTLMGEHGDEEITFFNRPTTTVAAIIDRLINQMDMIYHHINNGVEYDEDDEEWQATKALFLNPTGWMDGGSSYGLLIGGDGAQVVGIGARHGGTSDVTISNVEIHGIYNQVVEKIKYVANFGATRLIFFDAIDWNAVSTEILNPNDAVYLGDAYTDVTFAISQTVDSWYFLNSLYVSDPMTNYVFNGESALGVFHGGCGSDIQLHSSKGAIGLRVDGTQNIQVEDVYIHDVYNWADLGNEEWCGAYDGPNVGNEDIEIQYGYTGTRSHGMIIDWAQGTLRNVQIEQIESYHGEANGMTVYKECDLLMENIQVDHIYAGTQLDDEQVNALNLPNLVPRACGVDIRPNTVVAIDESVVGVVAGDDIVGFETCYDQESADSVYSKFVVMMDGKKERKEDAVRLQVVSMLVMIMVVMVFGIGVFVLFYCAESKTKKKVMMKEKKKTVAMDVDIMETVSEYTPLL